MTTRPGWKAYVLGEKDPFTSFLMAAAVAGVSIAGTWVLGNFNESRETARQTAQLMERVDNLTREVRVLNSGLATITVLTVRIEQAEKKLDRQEDALQQLRDSRTPKDMRDR